MYQKLFVLGLMVPKGQLEAAYSLGIRPKNAIAMSSYHRLRIFYQPWGMSLLLFIKDSLLLSAIGVMELWNGANYSINNNLFTIDSTSICSLLLLSNYDIYLDTSLESF